MWLPVVYGRSVRVQRHRGNLKAVGLSFPKIYDFPWSTDTLWRSRSADLVWVWFGFGETLAHNCIAAYSKDYSLASNLQAKQHMASRSSRVIPANNPPHSCKYSTGVSQYNKVWMQLQLPVEGRHPYLHYSVRTLGALVKILSLYSSKVLSWDDHE